MDAKHEVEVTADTVDNAVSAALAQLGAKPYEVIVEVIDEPSRGLLGIGAKPARVRVKLLRPPEPAPKPAAPVIYGEDEDDIDEYGDEEDGADISNDGQVAHDVLQDLLVRMDIEAEINMSRTEPSRPGERAPWVLDIVGPDVKKLIGRRGETLNSLQYVTRLIVSRQLQRRANVIVDADGYKAGRSDKLRGLANRMADQAVRQGRPVTLEPMPPNERRIIHLELREREDVETRSDGDGNNRKVTIYPKE